MPDESELADRFAVGRSTIHMAISEATHNRVVHMWMSAIGQAERAAMSIRSVARREPSRSSPTR